MKGLGKNGMKRKWFPLLDFLFHSMKMDYTKAPELFASDGFSLLSFSVNTFGAKF